MTQSCILCIETIYGVKGDNLTLVCPFAPPKENGMTTWFGPPSFTIYFYNEVKNPKDLKGWRLSVVKKRRKPTTLPLPTLSDKKTRVYIHATFIQIHYNSNSSILHSMVIP